MHAEEGCIWSSGNLQIMAESSHKKKGAPGAARTSNQGRVCKQAYVEGKDAWEDRVSQFSKEALREEPRPIEGRA
eukprot:1094926-Pelagomonas_calceolata.AAC.3